MSSKGIEIPIYFSPSRGREGYQIAYYSNGRRVRERAPTLQDAEKRARSKIAELTAGVAHVSPLTTRQAAVVQDAIDILRVINVPLSEAVRQFAEAFTILDGKGTVVDAAKHYKCHVEQLTIPRKKLAEVVSEFLEYIKITGLSQQYMRDCRARLKRAKVAFRTDIGEIPSSAIAAWLSSRAVSPRTFNNDRNALVTLFNFAKKRGYLPEGQRTAPERVEKRKEVDGEVQILTPGQYATLLDLTPSSFIPYVTLGGLAGLRTAEIARLHWEEVDLEEDHIVIKAAKAKTASRRIVPICPALKKWLIPLNQKSGRIMPYANEQSMMNRWSELKANMITNDRHPIVHIPTNALRHSYASYRLALVEDAAKVALEMGNSPRKLFQNYRQLVTKKQAEIWFAAFPRRDGK